MSTPSGNFPRSHRLSSVMLAVVGLGATWLDARGANAVVISASAVREYVRPKDSAGQPRPETYVFTEGVELAGNSADASMKKVTFDQIIRTLAVSLAKQNYFPTRDVPAANLVIRVYWGTTVVYEDPWKQQTTEALNLAVQDYQNAREDSGGGFTDPGAINQSLRETSLSQMTVASAVNRNALLLGYRAALERERAKPMVTAVEMSLSSELNEERYFVVLIAYDYQLIRQKKKATPLWITRLSIRTPGNSFTEAMPALAVAGGDIFGKQIDDLVRVKAKAVDASVKLDELKFLGDVKVIDKAGSPAPATTPNPK